MIFEVYHGGFRFELAAEIRGGAVLAIAMRDRPNSHQRHVDAWQAIADAIVLANRFLSATGDLPRLTEFVAGDGALGAVLDALSIKLRRGGMHAL